MKNIHKSCFFTSMIDNIIPVSIALVSHTLLCFVAVRSEIKCIIGFFCILGKGLICCGDDKGSLWLYNLPQFGRDSPNPALKTKIDVSTRLMWPELQVSFLEFSLI